MNIIAKSTINKFLETNPRAKQLLLDWYKTARKSDWQNFVDVRNTFRHADVYQDCVIFDVGGNKYRLIAKIRYRIQRIYIRRILTHAEYDRGLWKEDCRC